MKNNDEVIDLLNDLICINNVRIEGYEKASEELKPTKDADSFMLLDRAQESRVFRNELIPAVVRLGGKPAENSTAAGKLYRTWMDLKTTFSGGSAKSIFELCEKGEDAALQAYNDALQENVNFPTEIHQMLSRQKLIIQEAHDTIKRKRDALKREVAH
jgi:uncharacterized protein (TIGR02284 family)